MTNAGTEPVPGLFVQGETWLARIVWDSDAPIVDCTLSRCSYYDAIVSADLSRPNKEIHFDVASADVNGATVTGQPDYVYDRVHMGLTEADVHGSSGGQPFTASFSDLLFQLEDRDAQAFDSLELSIDPRPLSQFEVRGFSLDIPNDVGERSTIFLITALEVSAIPEPGTGLLVALGLVLLSRRGREDGR